ncbi:hypothetical protein D3C81_2095870 [compost metagenome]
MHNQHVVVVADHRYGFEVLDRVVGDVLVQTLVHRVRAGGAQCDGVAVRRGPRRLLGADDAGRAALVDDDDALL